MGNSNSMEVVRSYKQEVKVGVAACKQLVKGVVCSKLVVVVGTFSVEEAMVTCKLVKVVCKLEVVACISEKVVVAAC